MRHGLLIINKERGFTSHQVVAKLRRLLKQSEIGHTGTLDPEATGVLVVGLGDATRSFQFLNEEIKVYHAEMILGQSTDTQDASGKVIREQVDFELPLGEIEQAIREFTGVIEQVPPMYSAVKLQGKKLYELARTGMEVERQARAVKVFEWTIDHPRPVYRFRDRIYSKITCSKGTYIRTLLHDLGNKLGCWAHMGQLTRFRSGRFELKDALTLGEVEQLLRDNALEERIISISKALEHLESIRLKAEDRKKAINGGKLSFLKYPLDLQVGSFAKAVDTDAAVLAIVRLDNAGEYLFWQPVKVFRNIETV